MNVTAGKTTRLASSLPHCSLLLLTAAFLACSVMAWPAGAVLYTLEDRNSTVDVEADSGEGASSWVVDDTDHMDQQ